MSNGIRYSCRIRLTDFIETEFEEDVVFAMEQVSKTASSPIFIKLWYLPIELTQKQIEDFISRYGPILEQIGTNIHCGKVETWTQKSWCNIRRDTEQSAASHRYELVYTNPSDIVQRLIDFRELVNRMSAIPEQQTSVTVTKSYEQRSNKPTVKVVIRNVNPGGSKS